ncbi:MAG: eukaryotic-like serine/threonine-protein kinase [Myxococcales bacterium]|nr:eukaryotic-like serine/threonine-protein kinase [Myxococcales bacterium]
MNSVRPDGHQLPRAGDVVAGKYRIESVIGTGGMGVVLGAHDTSLGRRVAIKFLAPNKARKDDAAARFVREARAAASIQSEHVVRVFEVGTLPSGASYIVMEHLTGGDLAQILGSRGALPIHEAVDYVLEACEAIGEAHNRGIVHRDLKPQNLFVTHTPDGSSCVKVLDFGISKAIDEEAPNLTATDTVMGTPLYMSPEQVRSLKSVDLRSDIWALGAILFELVSASPIYEAASATALCAMIAMDPPTPLRARRPDAPPELEALILRCLHKDPNGRFADVAALAEALMPFASERGRASAASVVRVVRGGQVPPAASSSPNVGRAHGSYAPTGGIPSQAATGGTGVGGGGGLLTTGGHVSAYPPGAVHAAGYTAYAQQANQVPTQQTWQHQTGAVGAGTMEQRRSGSALFAILGVVAGLFLITIIGGGIVFFVTRQKDESEAAKAAQVDAATAAAAAPPVSAAAPPTVPVAVAPPPVVAGKKGAVAAKGTAGTSAPVTPASGSAAPAGGGAAAAAAQAQADADQLARQKQNAQGRCSAVAALFRGNDQDAARQVKNMTCTAASSFSPNSGSSNCDRANCRRACTILNDQSCIFQLDNAERGNPLKF